MFVCKPASKASIGNRSSIHGVGINDAPYITSYKTPAGDRVVCPFYRTWASMIERCYSKPFHLKKPTYASCTLSEEWKTFSTFKQWMEAQDWKGKVLDKDLINWQCKHYSPQTCLFVSPEINNLITLRGKARGPYPLGVSRTIINKCEYFVASCSFHGTQKRLGYYKTPEEAHEEYKKAKLAHIKSLAKQEKDPRVKQALLNIF